MFEMGRDAAHFFAINGSNTFISKRVALRLRYVSIKSHLRLIKLNLYL